MKLRPLLCLLPLVATGHFAHSKTPDGKPLVVFIAGKPSHGPGEHEHNAGVQLLSKCLNEGLPGVATKVHLNAEWPSSDTLAQADTVVVYSDGQGGHAALAEDRLTALRKEMDRGCGFVCLHYAVEPVFSPTGWSGPQKGPDGKPIKTEIPAGRGSSGKGAAEFLEWLGGYFEQFWSVNPHWTANFSALPKHPISNGVKPFSTNDEWYFHMRFRAGMKGVTPILSALAPPETMNRGEGPHAGNPDVKREVLEEKKPQHVAWAAERPNGGRGFGFTGGHFHRGWGNDDQRKLVLNAIVWTAKAEVPASGVESKVTPSDLEANLDPKPARKSAPAKPAAAAGATDGTPAKPLFNSAIIREEPVDIRVDLKGARELFLAVTDGGDGFVADWADWIEPVLVKADGSKVKLTELPVRSSKVGYGQLGVNRNSRGQPLRVGGQPIAFGFGAHAPSIIAFDLPADVVAFQARGGIDNGGTDQKQGATVTFQVFSADPGKTPLISQQTVGSAGDRYGLEAAKKNLANFITAPGLEVSLVAAEPMIQNPTAIDIDPGGRIWAVECVNYRKYGDLRKDGDRVVILQDNDQDGMADQETTFFQSEKLTNPLGICVLPGTGGEKKGTQVLVSAAPNLWLLTDTDGDDRADQSQVLLTVSGGWNHDHQLHAFTFGFDGKLYFNFGNESRELKDPSGEIIRDLAGNRITADGKPYRQGMVFRCDLIAGKLINFETLGWNFRNNYKVAIDSFGTVWQSDNDDDGNKGVRINYVMEYGNYGYTDERTGAGWRSERTNLEAEIPLRHWHQNDPGVVPNLLQTGGGSPTGITVNESHALGAAFANQVIHCDAGPRTVRAYPVEKDGAGYKATMVDLLTSTDNWYRPSDVAIAPDGSLVISDWYDPGVGGHGMGDQKPGQIMGRIYRVKAKGGAQVSKAPDFSTAEGAALALQSPNRATAYVAWQILKRLGDKAEPALFKLAQHENPRVRARALGVLAHGKSATKALRAGLNDSDADVRVAAVRLCNTLERAGQLDTSPLDEDAALVGRMLRDPSPQVRRQVAISLYRTKEIAPLWAGLAQQYDGKDRWYLEALGIGSIGNEDECLQAWLALVGDQWNTPAGRDLVWRVRAAKSPELLAKIIADGKVGEAEKPRFFRAFDFLPATPQKTASLVQLASLDGVAEVIARESLTRLENSDLQGNPALSAALNRTLERAKGSPQFVALVRELGLKDQSPALLETALALGSDPAAIDAVKLVLAAPAADQLIATALSGAKADAALALLGSTSTPPAITLLSGIASDVQKPLHSRQQAVRALARTQPGAEALLRRARNGKLATDLHATAASALRMVQYAALQADIDAAFPPPASRSGGKLPPISELVKRSGDVQRGRAIFERAESSCITCHRVNDRGVDFGPALSEIGTKLPKEAIYDAIIKPNAGVTMGFETTQVTLKDGGAGLGIVRSETGDELVLALPGGVETKFRRTDIARREKLSSSLMPSGLNQALSENDLVDLVEYLASLKKK